MFVVPAGTPGMEIVRDIPTMAHPDVEFGQSGQPRRDRLPRLPGSRPTTSSGDPGDGFVLAQKRLGGGRIHHAMRWIGQAQRSLDIMCERAVSRDVARQAARPAPDDPGLRRAVVHRDRGGPTAHLPDRVEDGPVRRLGGRAPTSRMVKAHVSRVVLTVLDRTIQVCGALGYSGDLPVEGWYRSHPIRHRSATVPTRCTRASSPARC